MKLKSLKLHGFKSFADSTEVRFHGGVTAIVGPNGCGKSNISDAIRWVLGEQRAKAIRGARMEEAIFQGSVHRRPVNRGSVAITVTNESGALPVPFEEVELSRTVYRDGGSDYSINRSGVRLKDVVDLTRDTGLGAGANVIENRMIDAILSDRADERRGLFEEAAGIGRYKDRRRAATRRLERAELDLERLQDVIAEVESKVRSLARQKGRAERWLELRSRRLDVDVAIVRHQLGTLRERLGEVESALADDATDGTGQAARVQTAESEYETLRLRQVDVQKARSTAAAQLDRLRGELVRWERELAVAGERAAYAQRRLAQIAEERTEARTRIEALDTDGVALDSDAAAVREELAVIEADLESRRDAADAVRTRLQQARGELEEIEREERDLARRGAQLEGDAEAAEAQSAELERRVHRLEAELGDAADALTDMASQGDLFAGHLQGLKGRVDTARSDLEQRAQALTEARAAMEQARAKELEAADRAGRLSARRSALEALERDREGMEPVVQAVLEAELPGVHGVLVDSVGAPAEVARAVEAWLGPLARALVVADASTAARVRHWFTESWDRGGGLLLLPLDRVPAAGSAGSLLRAVEPRGPGAPWVRALLAGVDLLDEAELLSAAGTVGVSTDGLVRDSQGVVRLGNPSGGGGILERRDELAGLARDEDAARAAAEQARQARDAARSVVQAAEAEVDRARTALSAVEDDSRKAEAEMAAAVDRRDRLDRHRDELARQLEATRATVTRTAERAREARIDRSALREREQELSELGSAARTRVEAVQEEWEAARAEQSRLELRHTRLQGEASRLSERIEAGQRARETALARVAALDTEEAKLGEELEQVTQLQATGAEQTEQLFVQRDEAQAALAGRDAEVQSVTEALAAAERVARQACTEEREAIYRRHRLELERQELAGRIDRARDRLEGEWGRTLEQLFREAQPIDAEVAELEGELKQIVIDMERIGAVNMLAVEEHEEESERLAFLKEQQADLVAGRDDLRAAIREINETATDLFVTTFDRIRENFKSVHQRLFEGGEADIWLEDGEDVLESTIEIHASPRGKKTQRIDLLSGGERALTALSLLFAIYLVKPSPFCVLDEVDAPLDENNIGRFIRLLHDFKDHTQFVVITHNPRTIEASDWIYGVTMEEPGVSTIVGVRLEEALEQARGEA